MLRGRLPLSISAAAALTLACGVSVTAVLFAAISQLEYDKMSLSLQQRAGARVAAIEQGLDDAVEVLTTTNQLFAAVVPVTRAQFHDFTTPLLQRHPFIQAFNFHRFVPHAQRAALEAELRSVVPDYVMTEMRDGVVVPAATHASYLVVDYLEPLQGNRPAFGLNVRLDGLLAGALEQAIVSGQTTATGLLALAQGPQRGFVILRPVYRHGLPLQTVRSGARRWWATPPPSSAPANWWKNPGRRRPAGRPAAGSERVCGRGRRSPPVDLPARPGAGRTARQRLESLPPWLQFAYHSHYNRAFSSAGRPWHVRVVAHPRPFLADHMGSLFTLIAGLLFSLLTAAFVQSLTQRSRRVQLLVEQRTADLKRSNELLSADVRARQRTERRCRKAKSASAACWPCPRTGTGSRTSTSASPTSPAALRTSRTCRWNASSA
jgi:CHASE1-domain containing sensor protein